MPSDRAAAAHKDAKPRTLGQKIVHELREWAVTLSVFIPLFFVFSMLAYEQRVIPSESMVPNLRVGDRVAVSKFAYGYSRFSVPWGLGRLLPLGEGRLFGSVPERGDVAVFMHPHFNRVMIKRVIGLPGDRVEMKDEQLFLNGEPVPTAFEGRVNYIPHQRARPVNAREYSETLDGKSYLTHQWRAGSQADTTATFIVPQGHVLFIGDNRDNSKDGRDTSGHCPDEDGVIDEAGCALPPSVPASEASIGFVPLDHLIGRAETVIFSTHRCRTAPGIDCPKGRLWKGL
ncbi:MAG: signal peptidase I [Alphaproteobacteria bacterium]|jgi:signal peptidase I|nr:signal peptidase I [Alphaproteobacteria bacterium]